jgi:F-type H+-transporting ATPase subunit b
MLIDWFTVGAQVLNFLVLVWLLSRFLYKPILRAISAREKSIVDERADTDAKRSEAQSERNEFQNKNKAFAEQRTALFLAAENEAKADGQRILDTARKEANDLRVGQESALRSDRARLDDEITHLAGIEVVEIARKALSDLATANLEERIVAVFTRRLHEMNGKAKETLGAALKVSPEDALVRSAFDLPPEQRAAIQNALNETFSAEIRVRFETAGDVLCGIELTSSGQKVGWSIADYLRALNQKVDALFDAQFLSSAKTTPEIAPVTTTVQEPEVVAQAK